MPEIACNCSFRLVHECLIISKPPANVEDMIVVMSCELCIAYCLLKLFLFHQSAGSFKNQA